MGKNQVQLQIFNGLYLILQMWRDLAAKASVADPETYRGFNKMIDYDVAYGLTLCGPNWKVCMLKYDPNLKDGVHVCPLGKVQAP